MKMFKKLLGVISAAVMTVSLFSGIYSASAVITGGYMRDHINLSDCEEIDGGTLQVRKGGKKEIPNSQDAYVIQIEDESIATFEPTEIGPSYRVIGLKNGTTKVTLVSFGTPRDEKYVYTVEISDEFPKELILSDSETSINSEHTDELYLEDPYDDGWRNVFHSANASLSIYNDNAKWTSDNKSIVTVRNGKLYPKAVGTATVTATLNGVEYKCAVTVTDPVYIIIHPLDPVKKPDIDSSNYKVIDAGTIQVRKGGVKNIPNSRGAYEIIIEDESVAEIDYTEINSDYINPDYRVTGLENGTTKVSVVPYGSEDKKYVYTVEVSDEFSKDLKLSDSKVDTRPNKKDLYLHLVDPYDDGWFNLYSNTGIYDDNAKWTSDNESVVIVRNGNLYPKADGTATVTASLDGIEYQCAVTVTDLVYDYIKGDITKDDSVDLYDAIKIAESLIGKVKFTDNEKIIADYNGDGVVNIYDAIGIAKSLMK